MNGFLVAVGALIPSVGVGLLFWFVMRAVVRADGRERAALAALDRRPNAPADTASEAPSD